MTNKDTLENIYLKDMYDCEFDKKICNFPKLVIICITNIDLIDNYLIKKHSTYPIYKLNDRVITKLFSSYNIDYDDYVMFGDIYLNNLNQDTIEVVLGHKSYFISTNKFKPAFKTRSLYLWKPYTNNEQYLNVGYVTTLTNSPPTEDYGLAFYNLIIDSSLKFDYDFDDNDSISTNNIMMVGNKYNVLNLSNSLFNINIDKIYSKNNNMVNNMINNMVNNMVNNLIDNNDADDDSIEIINNIDNLYDNIIWTKYKGKKVTLIDESNPWFKDKIQNKKDRIQENKIQNKKEKIKLINNNNNNNNNTIRKTQNNNKKRKQLFILSVLIVLFMIFVFYQHMLISTKQR
jgi:hypothetical protein